jgi:hypothetical protein
MPIWTGQGADNNWSTGGNWDTGSAPNSTTPAIFDGSTGLNPNKNCIITLNANCTDFILTGYTGQITFTNTLTVNMTTTAGNITFSASPLFSMVGPNGITYNNTTLTITTRTLTTNGYTFGLPFATTGGNVASTLNFVGNFQVSTFTGGVTNLLFTGNELRVSGNFTGAAGGSSLKVLNGPGNITSAAINNLEINAPTFTRTFGATSHTITGSFVITAGNVVATGSTLSLILNTFNPNNATLNNINFPSAVYTVTILSNVNLTGNLTWGNSMVINGPGKIFVAGNMTGGGGSGNAIVEMIGTGTITNNINLPTIINSPSGTITLASNASFGHFTYISGTLNITSQLEIRGSLTITNALVITGVSLLRFRNIPNVNTTINLTTNGHSWPGNAEIIPSSGGGNLIITLNLIDNFTVLGNFSVLLFTGSVAAQTINNNNLFIRGNLSVTTPNGLEGTATIILDGTSSSSISATSIRNSLTVNKTGGASVTVSGNITWGAASRTLNLNSTTNFTTNNVTLTLSGTPLTILNASNSQFYNLTTAAGAQTININ